MIYNRLCLSRPIKDFKAKYLIVVVLHIYLHNGNPCHIKVVRMSSVLQKSIDSGTIEFFKITF